jgi:hypothetical protein
MSRRKMHQRARAALTWIKHTHHSALALPTLARDQAAGRRADSGLSAAVAEWTATLAEGNHHDPVL